MLNEPPDMPLEPTRAFSTSRPLGVSKPFVPAVEPAAAFTDTLCPWEPNSLPMRCNSSTEMPVISAYSSMVYRFTDSFSMRKPVRTATPFTSPSKYRSPFAQAVCSAGSPVAASMTTYWETALPSASFSSGSVRPASAGRMILW